MKEEIVESEGNKEQSEAGLKNIQETIVVTHHTMQVGENILEYSAHTGTIIIKEEDIESGEKQKAALFYIAYILDQPELSEKQRNRPVTFSFNGGPGSSSVWMHLGLLGPRRVVLAEDGMPLPPPYQLIENEFSLLTHSDLVFIDPVSTGYSRAVPKEKPEQFHNVKKDIESVGEFIRVWLTRNKRWNSAKYLIGESYGTTRAAGLAEYLQMEYGMYLNGIMLISSILNFITAEFNPGNDLPHILFLPSFTATAWYHKKLKPILQKDLISTIKQAREFAQEEYCLALMQGDQLPTVDRNRIAAKLAEFCGLSNDYVERSNLRINIHRFVKELLREEGKTVGRLDSRYLGNDRDSVGEYNEIDPSYAAILGPFSATMNDYVRRNLNYEVDTRYEILTSLYESWKYDIFENQYVNTAENLRKAFQANPALRVIVCNGYFDLATPFFATEYTFNHLDIPAEQKSQVEMKYYPSGHMMYVQLESLKQVADDLRTFIGKDDGQE